MPNLVTSLLRYFVTSLTLIAFSLGCIGQVVAQTGQITFHDAETGGQPIESLGSVDEGDSLTYWVQLTAEPSSDVTVTMPDNFRDKKSSYSGDAYSKLTLTPATLTFTDNNGTKPWSTRQQVTVDANDDEDHDLQVLSTITSNGDFVINHNPTGGGYSDVAILRVHIVDDPTDDTEVASILTSTNRLEVNENGSATYTVQINQPYLDADYINVTLSPAGQGIRVQPAKLIFVEASYGNADSGYFSHAVAQTITVTGNSDYDLGSGDRRMLLTHLAEGQRQNPDSTFAETHPIKRNVVVILKENDRPAVNYATHDHAATLNLVEGNVDTNGNTTANTYTVALAVRPTGNVTVTIPDVSGLTITPQSFTFGRTASSGVRTWNDPQSITVTAAEDANTTDTTATLTHTYTGGGYTSATETTITTTLSVAITDNDAPQLYITPNTLTLTEGGRGESLALQLSTAPTAAVTLTLSTGGSDATAVAATFANGTATTTVAVANWRDSLPINLVADDDAVDDEGRMATVTVTASGTNNYTNRRDSVTVVVNDNDTAAVVASERTVVVVDGVTNPSSQYSLRLASKPTHNVTVTITPDVVGPSPPTEITATPDGPLTFTPTDWHIPQDITLVSSSISGFTRVSDYFVTHTATSTDPRYHYISTTVATPRIAALGRTLAVQVDGSPVQVVEGSRASFIVRLDAPPTSDMTTVALTFATPSDGNFLTLSPASLTFTPKNANWFTGQRVTVTAPNDTLMRGGNTVTVNATPTGGGYTGLTAPTVSIVYTDNDAAGLITPDRIAVKEGGTSTYTVALANQPNSNVTVAIAPTSNAGFTVTAGTPLTFTPTNWKTPQSVTVAALTDSNSAGEQTTLRHTVTGDPAYVAIPAAQLIVPIVSLDDEVGLQLADAAGLPLVIADGLRVPENGQVEYQVKLQANPTATVTVNIAPTSNIGISVTAGATLTFTGGGAGDSGPSQGNWNVYQPVTLQAAMDADAINNTVILRHTANGGNYASMSEDWTVTATDGMARGVMVPSDLTFAEAAGTATYTLQLATQPSAAVTLSPISSTTAVATVATASQNLNFGTNRGPGGWDTPQTVTLNLIDNLTIDAAARTTTMTHTVAGGDYAGFSVDPFVVTLTDNETAGIVTTPDIIVIPEGGSADYTFALTTAPTANVTVAITDDYGSTIMTSHTEDPLVFTPDNWQTPKTVTVTAAADSDRTPNYPNLTHTFSGAAEYAGQSARKRITVLDAQPGLVMIDSNGQSVNSYFYADRYVTTLREGDSATYRIKLQSNPSEEVTINLSLTNNESLTLSADEFTFTEGGNGDGTSGNGNWDVYQDLTLTAAPDTDTITNIAELAYVASGGNYEGVTIELHVTQPDAEAMSGEISLSTGSMTLAETARTLTYTVAPNARGNTLTTIRPMSSDSRVVRVTPPILHFNTYRGLGGWDTPQQVTITVVDDAIDTVTDRSATITHLISTDTFDDTLVAGGITITLTDDDTAGLDITAENLEVIEGQELSYGVALTSQPTAEVTVDIAPMNEVGISVTTGTLTFTPANWRTYQSVTVTAANDSDGINEQTQLRHSILGEAEYANLNNPTLTVTAADNNYGLLFFDANGLSFDPSSDSVVVPEDDGVAGNGVESTTYRVKLLGGSFGAARVTVNINPTGNSDILVSPTDLTFTPGGDGSGTGLNGNWDVTQRVTVTAATDADFLNSTSMLQHTASGGNYADVTASVMVTENDKDMAPAVTVAPTSLSLVETEMKTYEVSLTMPPTAPVTVTLGGNDSAVATFDLDPPTLMFTADDYGAKTVTVTGANNSVVNDTPRTTTITHTVSSADTNYDGFDTPDVSVTLNENPEVTIVPPSLSLDGTGMMTYEVSLTTPPIAPVTVTLGGNDSAIATFAPPTLRFTADDYVGKTVTVTGATDYIATGASRTTSITHAVSSAGADYNGLDAPDVTVTVNDNPGVTVAPTSLSITEAEVTTYEVSLTAPPTETVTVTLGGNDSAVATFDLNPPTLMFTADDWRAKTVTVTGANNYVVNDTPRTTTITHTVSSADTDYDGFDTPAVSVTLNDNDKVGIEVSTNRVALSANEIQTYTIVLTSRPAANVTVTILCDSSNAACEDGGDSDITVLPKNLTFTRMTSETAGWNIPRIITVTSVGYDGNGRVNLTYGVESTDSDYAGFVLDPGEIIRTSSNEALMAIVPAVARVMSGQITAAIAARAGRALSAGKGRSLNVGGAGSFRQAVLQFANDLADGTRDYKDILGRTDFAMPLAATGGDSAVGRATIWGGADYLDVSATDAGISWRGDVLSTYLGVDTVLLNGKVGGIAFAHSRSDTTYRNESNGGSSQLTINSIHPYLGWKTGWVTFGRGTGEVTVTPTDGLAANSDVEMRSFGLGLQQHRNSPRLELVLKLETTLTELDILGNSAAGGNIPSTRIDSTRLRASMEGSRPLTSAAVQTIPTFAFGLRHSAGDGPTGTGVELGAGLRYINQVHGLQAEWNVHGLVGQANYEEWGVSGLVRYAAHAATGRGLALRLEPSWGETASTIATMWNELDDSRLHEPTATPAVGQLTMRLDYGIGRHGMLITPYHTLTLAEQGHNNRYQLGVRWQRPHLEVELSGEQQQPNTGAHENTIRLHGRFGF